MVNTLYAKIQPLFIMWKNAESWIYPPPKGDSYEDNIRRLFATFLIISFVLTSLPIFLVPLLMGEAPGWTVWVTPPLCILSLVLLHKRSLRSAAAVLLVPALILNFTAMGLFSGYRDVSMQINYAILVLFALFMGRVWLTVMGGISGILVTLLFVLEQNGVVTTPYQPPQLIDLVIIWMSLVFVVLFLRLTAAQILDYALQLNNQAVDLRSSKTELEAYRNHLEDLVTLRTAELEDAKSEAENANRTKSMFLANMSHELRTPLNAIIGYSEILQEDFDDDARSRLESDARRIEKAGRHLLGVINSILDISKIEANQMDLQIETFDLDLLFADIRELTEPSVYANNNVLVIENDEELRYMHTDRAKVKQVLINLLSNAAKFTQNGQVTLQLKRTLRNDQVMCVFNVIDTGIGIRQDVLHRIFNPFEQSDNSLTRPHDGTGLGLAICKNFAEILGGEISVTSVPQVGTNFMVVLPKELQDPE